MNIGTITLIEIGLNSETLLQVLLIVLAIAIISAHSVIISFKI